MNTIKLFCPCCEKPIQIEVSNRGFIVKKEISLEEYYGGR